MLECRKWSSFSKGALPKILIFYSKFSSSNEKLVLTTAFYGLIDKLLKGLLYWTDELILNFCFSFVLRSFRTFLYFLIFLMNPWIPYSDSLGCIIDEKQILRSSRVWFRRRERKSTQFLEEPLWWTLIPHCWRNSLSPFEHFASDCIKTHWLPEAFFLDAGNIKYMWGLFFSAVKFSLLVYASL